MADAHQDNRLVWRKVLAADELPEGRVTSVTCDKRTLCMSHHAGQYGALDNKCPHQGRPLGEGSIENGLLRCPWHGWDYDPITGKAPGFDDRVETFPVEIRDDGVYVGLPTVQTHVSTVGDLMIESLTNWGVKQVFGMVGHSNLGVADALRIQEQAGRLSYYGIRHEGAASFACSAYGKLTGRPAACLSIAGPGATNLLTGLWDANVDRAPVIALTGQVETQVLGPGAFQEIDQVGAFGKVAQWSQTVFHDSRHAELINLACKSAILNRGVSHLIFPDEVPKRALPEPTTAGSPEGRLPSRAISPPADALQAALDLLRASKRPVIVVGHSCAVPNGAGRRAGGTAQGSGHHHLQGEGPDCRQPSAGRRRARTQRHADRQLADERVRLPAGVRCQLQQSHRYLAEETHHPGGLRSAVAGQISRRRRAGLGRDRRHGPNPLERPCGPLRYPRSNWRRGGALGDLARREAPPQPRRPRSGAECRHGCLGCHPGRRPSLQGPPGRLGLG